MKHFKKLFSALLCATMLFSFTACTTQDSEGGSAETPAELQTVTVSEVTHSVFYAPQYVAMNLGFFEEEGIKIDMISGEGADKVMAALLSGHIDVGFAGPEAAIYVYNEGREEYPKIFGQVTKRDGSFLIGREEVGEFDWQSLMGSHVLPGRKGGVPYMTFEYTIRSMGLDPAVDLLMDDSIQFSAMTGAFVGGTGDYVTAFEPTASMIEAEGQGYIVASIGAESGEIPYTAYFANDEFLVENADLAEGFVRAIYRGQQWVGEHSAAEIAEVIAPSFPDNDMEILTNALERYKEIDAWCSTPIMEEDAFNKLQEVMTMAGELSEKADFNELVYNDIAEKIVAE